MSSLSGEVESEFNIINIVNNGQIQVDGESPPSQVLANDINGNLVWSQNDFNQSSISNPASTPLTKVSCDIQTLTLQGKPIFTNSDVWSVNGNVGTEGQILTTFTKDGTLQTTWNSIDNLTPSKIDNPSGTNASSVECKDSGVVEIGGTLQYLNDIPPILSNGQGTANKLIGTNSNNIFGYRDAIIAGDLVAGTNIFLDGTGGNTINVVNEPSVLGLNISTAGGGSTGLIKIDNATPANNKFLGTSATGTLVYKDDNNTEYTGTGNITVNASNQIGIINNPTFSTSVDTPTLGLTGSNPQILIGGTAPINKVLGTDADGNIEYRTETGTIYTASGNLSIDASNDITINNQPNFTTSTTTPQLVLDGSNPKILLDGTFGTAGQALVIDGTGQKLEYVSGAVSRTLVAGDNIDITIAGNNQTIALEDPTILGTLNALTINNHNLQLINDPDTGDPPTLKLGAELGNGANFQYLRAGVGGVVNYQNPWTNNKKYANAFRAVRYISLSNVLELSTTDDDTIYVFGLNYGYYFSSNSPLQRDWRQEIPEHMYLSSGLGFPDWTPVGSGLTQTCGQTNWMYKSPTSGTNVKSCYAIFLPPPASDAVMTFNITINLPAGVNQLPTGNTYALNSEVQGRTIRVGFPNKEGRLLGTILNQNFSASCPLTLEIADDVTYFILDPFQESSNNDTFSFDCGCHMEFTYYGDTTYVNCKVETYTESTITVPDRPTARDSFFGDGNATNGRKACRINSNMVYL